MAHNANMEHTSARGWSLLHHLFDGQDNCRTSNAEFFRIFETKQLLFDEIQDGRGWSALHRGAAYGTAEDLQWMVDRGARKYVDRRTTTRGLTPLHVAALFDNVSTLETLVNIQASPSASSIRRFVNSVDSNGWTPLHVAAERGAPHTMHWLLQHGADPHSTTYGTAATWFPNGHDGEHFTPKDLAAYSGEEYYSLFVETLQKLQPDVVADGEDIFFDSKEESDWYDSSDTDLGEEKP